MLTHRIQSSILRSLELGSNSGVKDVRQTGIVQNIAVKFFECYERLGDFVFGLEVSKWNVWIILGRLSFKSLLLPMVESSVNKGQLVLSIALSNL